MDGAGGSATLADLLMRCIEVVDGSLPEEVLDPWLQAWEADPAGTLFQHPAWCAANLPSVEGQPLIVSGPTATLPLRIEDGVLRFLPDPSVSDLAGPVGPVDREQAAKDMVAALEDLPWTSADLDGLFEEDGWLKPLHDAAESRGWKSTFDAVAVSPAIRLEGDFERYLADLDSKQRHEVRRKGRRLTRELGEWTTRLTDAATLQADLDSFFALHRMAAGDKGSFMTPEHEALFRRVAQATLDLGMLRSSWLETSEGHGLASVFSFKVRDRWLVWNSAFDPEYRNLSVGMVAMAEQIRLACEQGSRIFDLLRGDEEYKYRLGASDVAVFALRWERG
jgi:CelD/BcsL family acetyltransferase involved in cellulose biosynthesis